MLQGVGAGRLIALLLTCEVLLSKLYHREDHSVCQLLGQLTVETIELKQKDLVEKTIHIITDTASL